MGTTCSTPNWSQFLGTVWGFDDDIIASGFSAASNIVVGSNPPYSSSDFALIYPKFFGVAQAVTGNTTAGSAVITSLTSTAGFAPGQVVTGQGIPLASQQKPGGGAVIVTVDSNTQITLSVPATANGTGVALNVFSQPVIPMVVINCFITLATASLVQPRWLDTWYLAMAMYVAHFCTLWLRSENVPASVPGAIAAAGLARGITVSKGAGPVSQGIQPVAGLEDWAGFTQTEYGVQLITFAKCIGAGVSYVR
jgi:hypothetical protein